MANFLSSKNGKRYTRFEFWLVFSLGASAPRVTAREPKLLRHERAMFMQVTLPDALWSTPSLRGVIEVPDMGINPVVVNAAAAADAIKQAIGVDIDLVVAPLNPEEQSHDR